MKIAGALSEREKTRVSDDKDQKRKDRPFIIWTLQRTGGTNLAAGLFKRSSWPTAQHEPFNKGREFGHITDDWVANRDDIALQQAVEDICSRGVCIKHCVEVVPPVISNALARASLANNYEHIFLYRKESLGRLLSFHFARTTGKWGPGMGPLGPKKGVKQNKYDESSLPESEQLEPLPVKELVEHERRCVWLLSDLYKHLIEAGATPYTIAFEDIYLSNNPQQSREILLPLLANIGLSRSRSADIEFIDQIIGTGDQGTRKKYSHFERGEELRKALTHGPVFDPRRIQLAHQVMNDYRTEIALNAHSDLRQFYWPKNREVSAIFLNMFETAGFDVDEIRTLPFGPRYYEEIDAILCSKNETLEATPKTRNITPPKGVQWLRFQTGAFFDIITSDIISGTLKEFGISLVDNGVYMDFGCSSGRTIRTLWAAYPEAKWIGVDPVKTSIDWARENFPDITFILNDNWPPIETIDDSSINGVCAQSVWSHFSREAAIKWLDEMHRILKVGGFILLTTNGYTEIARQLRLKNPNNRIYVPTDVLERAINGMKNDGFYFEPNLISGSVIKDQTHWSHAFIAKSWFEKLCQEGKWTLRGYRYGRWGHKSDIYILTKI